MRDGDVVVVGAGPVGLLLACLLAQGGLRTVVCERRVDPDARTRAIGIHRPGLDALDAAGVGGAVRAEALRLQGGEVRSRRRTVAELTFDADRPVLVLPQSRTHALLRSRLTALSPDALRPGWTVRALRDEGAAVHVAVDTAAGALGLTAGVVVVADGVRSRFRRELAAGWHRRAGEARYAMVDVDADVADPHDRAVLHCEPEGLVESFPLPGGRRRWVARQREGEDLSTAAAFRAAVLARTGIRLSLGEDLRPASFHASQHTVGRAVHGRIMLLGDAAHELSPIGGQGMNLGWGDALRLAAALAARGCDAAPDLRGFEAAVRRRTRIAQRRSAFYMAMGAPATGVTVRGRELLLRALGSAPLRDGTAGLITMRGL